MKPASRTLLIALAVLNGIVALVALMSGGGGGAIALGLLGFVGSAVYFVPTFVALEREHGNSTAIIALNVLLGWLLLPWIGALIWALSRNRAVELIEAQTQQGARRATGLPSSSQATDERICPFCAETVKAAATICKHCRSELPPLPSLQPKPDEPQLAPVAQPAKPLPQGLCPSCDKAIALESAACPHCKADFGQHSSWKVKPL